LAASARYASLKGEQDRAITNYNLALEAKPSMPMVRLELAKLLAADREVNLAFNQYSKALETDPLHPSIQEGFIWGLMVKGDYVDAARYSEQFYQQNNNPKFLQLALRSYVATGQYDKSLEFAETHSALTDIERYVNYSVIESLYYLQRYDDGDAIRERSDEALGAGSQASLEVNKGVSLRDANIVYKAADMLAGTEGSSSKGPSDCAQSYVDYWRAYGAYIEREYAKAEQYFNQADELGFLDCNGYPETLISFLLYRTHSMQLLGDDRATAMVNQAAELLSFFEEKGWGGSRLSMFRVALKLVEGNFGQANTELIAMQQQDIEPFGMIISEPIFDDFYGNPIIEPTLSLARNAFERTRNRSGNIRLAGFGL